MGSSQDDFPPSKVWSKEEQLVERREQFLLQELKVSQELEAGTKKGKLPKGTGNLVGD